MMQETVFVVLTSDDVFISYIDFFYLFFQRQELFMFHSVVTLKQCFGFLTEVSNELRLETVL